MGMVSLALMSWLALAGKSSNLVIGVGAIPNVVACLKAVLNSWPEKYGVPAFGQYLNLAIQGATAISALTGNGPVEALINLYIVWGALNGFGLAIVPNVVAGAWGAESSDAGNVMCFKQMGGIFAMGATMAYALSTGKSATTAIDLAWAINGLMCLDMLFVSKNAAAVGVAPEGMAVWTVVSAAIVAA